MPRMSSYESARKPGFVPKCIETPRGWCVVNEWLAGGGSGTACGHKEEAGPRVRRQPTCPTCITIQQR